MTTETISSDVAEGADLLATAQQALEHPYVSQFHDPSVERTASKKVKPLTPDDEKKSTNFYREELYSKFTSKQSRREGGQDSRRGPSSGR